MKQHPAMAIDHATLEERKALNEARQIVKQEVLALRIGSPEHRAAIEVMNTFLDRLRVDGVLTDRTTQTRAFEAKYGSREERQRARRAIALGVSPLEVIIRSRQQPTAPAVTPVLAPVEPRQPEDQSPRQQPQRRAI